MIKILYKLSTSVLILVSLIFLSCDEEPTPSLYELPAGGQPTPVITSIDPPGAALAGVTELTITGQNFNPSVEGNSVFFNGVKAKLLSASTTQLKMIAPNVVADTVIVKISTYKSLEFSNEAIYKLLTAQEEYYKFNPNNREIPFAFLFNSSGEMLVSLNSTSGGPYAFGIKRITPARDKLIDYIPMGNAQKWDCLKFGPGNQLYGSRTVNAIWKLNEGVAPQSPWTSATGSLNKDIEFDMNQNIWAVGTANRIYSFTQTPSSSFFTVNGTFRSVRVFNGALYVAGARGATEGIWKFTILPNGDLDLTSEELYFDLSASYPGSQAFAITFAADGDLILGTNRDPDPIIIVHPNKSSEVLYPGVIPAGKVIYLYWPQGSTSLFFTREEKKDTAGELVYSQSIIRVEMQKLGAPYYGF